MFIYIIEITHPAYMTQVFDHRRHTQDQSAKKPETPLSMWM